jgi:Flp pilus assembly protein TadG
MNQISGKSNGQIAVLYAGIIAVLLGAIAFCADVSVMYVNWQQVQKTADAAALAGANYLKGYEDSTGYVFSGPAAAGCTGQPDDASKAACTYAVDNGLAAGNVTITEPTASSIQVVAQETGLPYYFAKVLDLSTYAVTATAVAHAAGPVGTVNQGMFPVALQCASGCSNLSTLGGEPVTFGQKFVSSVINASGNWEWLGLGGTGASALASNIQNGATGSYTIGDTISTAPGNKGSSGPVKKAVQNRLNSCPTLANDPCADGGNPNDIPAGDPCLVVVPAVNFNGCTGQCSMQIEGFALVYLESTTTNSSLSGCFVNGIAPTSVSSSTAPALGATQPPTITQ